MQFKTEYFCEFNEVKYYALPKTLISTSGTPTNTLFNSIMRVNKFQRQQQCICVCIFICKTFYNRG